MSCVFFKCLFLLSSTKNHPPRAGRHQMKHFLIHLPDLFLTKLLTSNCNKVLLTYLQQPVKHPLLSPLSRLDFIRGEVSQTGQTCVRIELLVFCVGSPGNRGAFCPLHETECCIHAEVSCMLGWAIWASGFWTG